MKPFPLIVSGIAALLWLLPTPGERAVAGLGLLAILWWISRLRERTRALALVLVCGVVIASVPAPFCSLNPRALGILAMVVSAGGWAMVVGGGWFLLAGCLARAAMDGPTTVLIRRNLTPLPWILAAASACGILASVASSVLTRGDTLARWDGPSLRRYGWAAVLNRRNPQVMSRSAYATVLAGSRSDGEEALRDLTDLERSTGTTAISLALRIVASAVAGRDARAAVAEAALRRPASLDSLAAWHDTSVPWRELAASLHTGRPPLGAVAWPAAEAMSRDSLVAEYAARLLADAGLEAEACTLASLPEWRDRGWSRFIIWKARQGWEQPRRSVAIGRLPQAVEAGGWLLTRGQPARGVWPVYRLEDESDSEEMPAWAEEWILVPRRIQSPCSVTLINDLRAPGEDRNAWIASTEGIEDSWYTDPPQDSQDFKRRLSIRLGAWGTAGSNGDPRSANVMETWTPVQIAETEGAIRAERGVMLPGAGHVSWHVSEPGDAFLVVRGQRAADRWPIMELSWKGAIRRHAVDASAWICLPQRLSSSGTLSVRFINDFWDPATEQDRNLWVAGLFIHPSHGRDHAR